MWPEGTHVDFDLGIKVAVQKLRAALRDVVEEPTYIQTVPGGGYRFIAVVTTAEPELTVGPALAIDPATAPRHSRWLRELVWAGVVAAGLGIVVLAIASYRTLALYFRSDFPDPSVTPFTSYTGHEAGASFSALAKLWYITSVFSFCRITKPSLSPSGTSTVFFSSLIFTKRS